MQKLKLVFENLQLGHVSMENVAFDGLHKLAHVEVESSEGRLRLIFRGVMGVRYTVDPLADRSACGEGEDYFPSLYQFLDGSEWLRTLHAAEKRRREPESKKLSHYVFPVEDGVWEILAHHVSKENIDI